VAIEQAIDEVQVSRPAAPGAHGELTGEMGLGTGREGSDFLVPDVHPLDLPLPPNGIGQTIEAVAHDAIDALYTCGGERRGKLFGNGCHANPLRASRTSRLKVRGQLPPRGSRVRLTQRRSRA
jgi:hypothetical protein